MTPTDRPAPSDPTWEAFRTTSLRIAVDGGTLEVVPTTGGAVRGPYLPDVAGPVHVLTAWNPQGRAASPAANAAAGERLNRYLATRSDLRWWPTTGVGQSGAWEEEGYTIWGLSRDRAVSLAVGLDQRAIFEWEDAPGGFRLVACDGGEPESRGWRSTLRR